MNPATTLFTNPPTALPAAHGNRCHPFVSKPPAGAGAASPAVAVHHFPIWLLALVLLVGCATPSKQILTASNRYRFEVASYEAKCHGDPTPKCTTWYGNLKELKRTIVAAEEANALGGASPLQLAAMKKAAKAAGEPK